MDLTNEFPRSPYEMMSGIVMLARTVDKVKADINGTQGEYHWDCPLSEAVFDFLGVTKDEFKAKVEELDSDEDIEAWANSVSKSKEEKEKFNSSLIHSRPPESGEKREYFDSEKKRLGKSDMNTWFELLDADEKRF